MLMNRQLFLHHYLPAHLASALVAGVVFNFMITENINFPISIAGPSTRLRPHTRSDIGAPAAASAGIFCLVMFAALVFLAPLTYGTPGYAEIVYSLPHLKVYCSLDGDQVNRRRVLSSWTLHFAVRSTTRADWTLTLY